MTPKFLCLNDKTEVLLIGSPHQLHKAGFGVPNYMKKYTFSDHLFSLFI